MFTRAVRMNRDQFTPVVPYSRNGAKTAHGQLIAAIECRPRLREDSTAKPFTFLLNYSNVAELAGGIARFMHLFNISFS